MAQPLPETELRRCNGGPVCFAQSGLGPITTQVQWAKPRVGTQSTTIAPGFKLVRLVDGSFPIENPSGPITLVGGQHYYFEALVKEGTGTFTLSGVNTYTGATTVSGGTLDVDWADLTGFGQHVRLVDVDHDGYDEVVAENADRDVLRAERWLRAQMRPLIEASLVGPDRNPLLTTSAVCAVWNRFLQGQTSWSRPWGLFVLQQWCERNL